MKIYALLGSPRPQGNTRAALDLVLQAAREAGAEVEIAELAKLKHLSGCRECFTCQKYPDETGCPIDDDVQEILSKSLTADVLVLASPVFCWSMSWLLKCVVDRMYCMFKFGGDEMRCLLKGTIVAGVITAGGDEKDGADLVQESFKRLAQFSGCEWRGALIAANVESAEDIRTDVGLKHRAQELGRLLAQPH